MGAEVKGLGRIILGLLSAWLVSWLGVAVLITLSIGGSQAALLLLLAWVLAVAGWLAVYGGPLCQKTSWWALALMAPALPLAGAVHGAWQRQKR